MQMTRSIWLNGFRRSANAGIQVPESIELDGLSFAGQLLHSEPSPRAWLTDALALPFEKSVTEIPAGDEQQIERLQEVVV